jgi:UDP-3-O-[3-hydroxymyristoyl] glucosamine N-acyltransferase
MRFEQPVSLTRIAELINAELVGDPKAVATGINEIHKVVAGDLVFVDHPKYYDKCVNSAASFIIINKRIEFPQGKALLITP